MKLRETPLAVFELWVFAEEVFLNPGCNIFKNGLWQNCKIVISIPYLKLSTTDHDGGIPDICEFTTPISMIVSIDQGSCGIA